MSDRYGGDSKERPFSVEYRLVHNLSLLPHKILQFYDVDGLSQLVLHELCHESGFNLKRATYLVDNPDFDHLVGAAGFWHEECSLHDDDLWHNPYSFAKDMKKADFHNHVKNFFRNSLRRQDVNLNDAKEVLSLAKFMGMSTPAYFSWQMKHGNHGILIFETGSKEDFPEWKRNLLKNYVALLSLCSVV